MKIIIKSNVKKVVRELEPTNAISSVTEEYKIKLEQKVIQMIDDSIDRAKQNRRRSLQARDL
ncbi:hypothetical protein KAI04_04385 [Candidatus Pacearchaeota archaeon]|nr:hypothetical protein [Candidatus Pacearchaeota archaeon]